MASILSSLLNTTPVNTLTLFAPIVVIRITNPAKGLGSYVYSSPYYALGNWPRRAKNPKDPDSFVADFLTYSVPRSYLIWYPNLVQHQVVVSEIDSKRSRFRQSKAFIK